MPIDKQVTPKQVAVAVLEKVGEILKRSELLKVEKKNNSELHTELEQLSKSIEGSEGHYSMVAAPEHPEAGKHPAGGKTSTDSTCPKCGHPTPAKGEGTTLPRSKAQEDWQEKCEKCEKAENIAKAETENSKKLGYKTSEEGNKEAAPEKSDHAFDTKPESSKSSDDARQGTTPNPEKNPKEQAEGNNELAGTTPTQVGQDGKNKPGGDEIKSHLKLAKFIGMKEYKRTRPITGAQAQTESSAQHSESIKNK